jgi:hypothetical protein
MKIATWNAEWQKLQAHEGEDLLLIMLKERSLTTAGLWSSSLEATSSQN